jgi:hypothetical protein
MANKTIHHGQNQNLHHLRGRYLQIGKAGACESTNINPIEGIIRAVQLRVTDIGL